MNKLCQLMTILCMPPLKSNVLFKFSCLLVCLSIALKYFKKGNCPSSSHTILCQSELIKRNIFLKKYIPREPTQVDATLLDF